MTPPAPVGRTAFLLGFAGLLPQALNVLALLGFRWFDELGGPMIAGLVYPIVILSFLGGMWWGFAMRRVDGQGRLAALAVVPSLAALALLGLLPIAGIGWTIAAVGIAILLTLPVDRHLVVTGEAPANWMRLRVPLSVGLGGLTILLGALVGDFNLSI